MKFIIMTVLALSSMVAQAAPAQKFSKKDYANFVKDDALTFSFSASGTRAFNTLRLKDNDCDKAILASIATASFRRAEEDGVDYPEIIDITNANSVRPMPGIEIVKVNAGEASFKVRYYPSSIPCLADSAE
jgi:hypothetical protein